MFTVCFSISNKEILTKKNSVFSDNTCIMTISYDQICKLYIYLAASSRAPGNYRSSTFLLSHYVIAYYLTVSEPQLEILFLLNPCIASLSSYPNSQSIAVYSGCPIELFKQTLFSYAGSTNCGIASDFTNSYLKYGRTAT